VIAEGVETALSYARTGLGLWAAGGKERLPALAPAVERLNHIECLTISTDEDEPRPGQKTSRDRAEELRDRINALRPDIEVGID
jgi:hypothetical protein